MSTYLLAQSVLLLLFALPFMAIHRTLLAQEGYGLWLESRGGSSSQWVFVVPVAAIAYALPARALFATIRRPIGALLPCAVGLAVYLLLKNVIYALLQQPAHTGGVGWCGLRPDDRIRRSLDLRSVSCSPTGMG